MKTLIYDIIIIIINLLDFNSKINLYKTSKKYKFVLSCINIIPNNFIEIITDYSIKNLSNITELDISYNKNITDNGIKNLTNITKLSLQCNEIITDYSIKNLSNITELDISYNKNITDDGIKNLTNITELDLCCNYTFCKKLK